MVVNSKFVLIARRDTIARAIIATNETLLRHGARGGLLPEHNINQCRENLATLRQLHDSDLPGKKIRVTTRIESRNKVYEHHFS